MQPRFENLSEKILIGKRIKMSFLNNKTFELWQAFMPKRKEIINCKGTELYSVEVYPPLFFETFSNEVEFEKWAAVEVSSLNTIPDGMESLVLPKGLYAVFIHKGLASKGFKTYQYIFQSWIPSSEYQLDNRPHFAIMGDKYKNEDPDSEEEIWIPIKKRL